MLLATRWFICLLVRFIRSDGVLEIRCNLDAIQKAVCRRAVVTPMRCFRFGLPEYRPTLERIQSRVRGSNSTAQTYISALIFKPAIPTRGTNVPAGPD